MKVTDTVERRVSLPYCFNGNQSRDEFTRQLCTLRVTLTAIRSRYCNCVSRNNFDQNSLVKTNASQRKLFLYEIIEAIPHLWKSFQLWVFQFTSRWTFDEIHAIIYSCLNAVKCNVFIFFWFVYNIFLAVLLVNNKKVDFPSRSSFAAFSDV